MHKLYHCVSFRNSLGPGACDASWLDLNTSLCKMNIRGSGRKWAWVVWAGLDLSVLWPLSCNSLEAPPHFLNFRFNIFTCLWKGMYKMLYYIHTGCPGENVPEFGRMFLTLKYTDLTQNTYIRSWTLTEIMAREKCGLVVLCTVTVSRIVTRTLRMSVLQSHSQVKHILTSLSTDVTVTVNCNSVLLDIPVPCKVFGTLRTTTTLVRVYVV